MPSPFPGMDPYLEAPERFRDFHDSLIVSLKYDLQPRLPEGYFVRTNRRLWLEGASTPKFPDLDVHAAVRPPDDADFVAVMAVGSPVVIESAAAEPEYQTNLEITRRTERGDRLLTAVEVLSPTNKAPGEDARGSYLQKQREYLASGVSLIEIDLLRAGTHATAIPSDDLAASAGQYDYHVCLRHAASAGRFLTYPFTLRTPLPEIPVPLGEAASPVAVSLQEVFTRCYELSGYRGELDYSAPPPPPRLSADDAVWCDELLREAGLRTAN